MPEMKFFNYAGAVQTAEKVKGQRIENQLNVYKLEETKNLIERRKRVAQIMQQHRDGPARIDALEAQGLHEEARELAESWMDLESKRLDIVEQERNAVSAENWEQYRYEKKEAGLSPTLMPVEYDDNWFRDTKDMNKDDFKRITQIYGTEDGPMAQDITTIEGEVSYGAPYDPKDTKAPTGGKGDKYSAADANAMARQIRAYYGSLFNATTGEFNTLDPEVEAKIAGIQATAEKMYRTGRYSGHLEAVQAALAKHGEKTNRPDPFNVR